MSSASSRFWVICCATRKIWRSYCRTSCSNAAVSPVFRALYERYVGVDLFRRWGLDGRHEQKVRKTVTEIALRGRRGESASLQCKWRWGWRAKMEGWGR